MVEGGRIDHAHHEAWASRALYETLAFEKAVKTAYDMTDPSETLIIVTADHGHGMVLAGYLYRNLDIRGNLLHF